MSTIHPDIEDNEPRWEAELQARDAEYLAGLEDDLADRLDAASMQAEQDAADRWLTVVDRLTAHGIVSQSEAHDMPLSELERLAAYLGPAT